MMEQQQQMNNTLSYIEAELNRIQTIAGTLASIEKQHYQDLINMGDDKLNQLAVEEQSAARQLGEVKQICLSLAQKIREIGHQNDQIH
jgi:hypothetical protein